MGAEMWAWLLAAASAVVLIWNAVKAFAEFWAKLKAPHRRQEEDLKALKKRQEQQGQDIQGLKSSVDELKKHHEDDMGESREERQLIVRGLLACLKGLREQGCNDAVPKAIDEIEEYINGKAHEA